jgi:hypothetical protein
MEGLSESTDLAHFVALEPQWIAVDLCTFGPQHAAVLLLMAQRFGRLKLTITARCEPSPSWSVLGALGVPLLIELCGDLRWMAAFLPPDATVFVHHGSTLAALRAPTSVCVPFVPKLGRNLDALRCLGVELRDNDRTLPLVRWAAAHPCLETLWLRGGRPVNIDPLVRANRLRELGAQRGILRTPMLLAHNTALRVLDCDGWLGDAHRFNRTLARVAVGDVRIREPERAAQQAAYARCAAAAVALVGVLRACQKALLRAMRATLAENAWLETK